MRKDGGGATTQPPPSTTSSPPLPIPCLDLKPFIATLLLLTLIMAVWQLQPYESLLSSRPSCPLIPSLPKQKLSNSLLPNLTISTPSTDPSTVSTPSTDPSKISPKISTSATDPLSISTPSTNPSKISPKISTSATDPLSISTPSTDPPKISAPIDPNKRIFLPVGSAAALFVQMGAYRGGPNTFAVVGLASKPTHVFSKPWFKCEWIPNSNSPPIRAKAYKMLPDWGYGRVYTVVVVNCTFPTAPNADNAGGKLLLYAYYSPSPRKYEKFVALEEPPNSYNESRFRPPFQYDYLYCGSSLYGSLSAKRIREWMAYHAYFFGPRSHFVFHDAGGVGPAVRAVLDPWVKAGRATIQDIRGQEEYDGYYYNQFLVVNDCLHRYRHSANWTFYFDVDEYLYLPGGSSLEKVLGELSKYTQFTIEQNPMSSKLCVKDPKRDYSREWGFEKLVFRNSITGIRRDRKYAIQARNAYATGVHMSENIIGRTTHKTDSKIRYYHYHDSINVLDEPCREFVPKPPKGNLTWFEKVPYVYDDNMQRIANTIKKFEEQTIGPVRV